MGNEHSKGSSGGPDDKPEAHQVERDTEKQPAEKPSSAAGNEVVTAHPDEESTSQTAPPREEVASNFLPAEGTGILPGKESGPQVLPEGGQPPSQSPAASSNQGQPTTGQTGELDTAKSPVEHSSEKAGDATPQIPLEAAGKPEEGPSRDAKLQTTAVAEPPAQKSPGEISPCSAEKDPKGSNVDDGSFEIITEVQPGPVSSETVEGHRPEPPTPEVVGGHSDTTSAPVTRRLEPPSSAEEAFMTVGIAEAYFMRVVVAPLPTAEAHGEQHKGRSVIDAKTTEGAKSQTASRVPKEAASESTLAQQTVDTLEKLIASYEHAGTKTTEIMHLGKEHKEHPALATIHDPEVASLPDHLASSKVFHDLDEDSDLSLAKEMAESCSGLSAAEIAAAQASLLGGSPQTVHVSCTEVTLESETQETHSVAVANANAQLQGSSDAQKSSAEGPAHEQKQEAKFSKTFYLCCGQHGDGNGEANAKQ